MEKDELAKCISRALSTFGVNSEQATYAALQRKGIYIQDIQSNPEALLTAVREVFGPGYPIVEREIVKEIKTSLEPFSSLHGSYSLVDVLESARERIVLSQN